MDIAKYGSSKGFLGHMAGSFHDLENMKFNWDWKIGIIAIDCSDIRSKLTTKLKPAQK